MPDGTETENTVRMIKAWEKIYKPICKELGMDVIGFDPGILFGYQHCSVNIPTSLAVKIRDLVLENRRLKKMVK